MKAAELERHILKNIKSSSSFDHYPYIESDVSYSREAFGS